MGRYEGPIEVSKTIVGLEYVPRYEINNKNKVLGKCPIKDMIIFQWVSGCTRDSNAAYEILGMGVHQKKKDQQGWLKFRPLWVFDVVVRVKQAVEHFTEERRGGGGLFGCILSKGWGGI